VWDSLKIDNAADSGKLADVDDDEEMNFGFGFTVPDRGHEDDHDDDDDDDTGITGSASIRHAKSARGPTRRDSRRGRGSFRAQRSAKDTDSELNEGSVANSTSTVSTKKVGFAVQDDQQSKQSVSSLGASASTFRTKKQSSPIRTPQSLNSAGSNSSVRSQISRSSSMLKKKAVVTALTRKPTESEILQLQGAARWKAIVQSKRFIEYKKEWKTNKDTSNFSFRYQSTFKPRKIENPVHVSFDRLKLVLKSNRKSVLLHDIFGTIHPFHITALMGPSGSGKTTLLNMLRGVAHYATAEGVIFVNRVATTSLAAYRDEMAFVPQEDILYDELTVEENVIFSAILFNRRGYTTRAQVQPMVHHALLATGLARDGEDDEDNNMPKLKHSVVGGTDKKGISGGQKKRVSIAMEMMKEAAMFFLDGTF
jgi:ABC-type lipoprotein export system ATPase subunit